MTDNLIERLLERARAARSEKTATALGDALHFEEAATALQSAQKEIERLTAERDSQRELSTYRLGEWSAAEALNAQLKADLKSVADLAIQHEDRCKQLEADKKVLHDTLTAERREREELRKALEPFAALADIFDFDGGNRVTSGTISTWSDHRIGDRELTVEHLRRARAALNQEKIK